MSPLTIIILFAAAWLIGFTLLSLGLRGRRGNDHPLCRRCGFDLFGLPKGGSICSECGADLKARRAIRHGARQRRPAMIALGLIFLLPMATATGVAGWARARHIDPTPYKPVWWLVHDAASTDANVSNAGFTELLNRQGTNRLSRRDVQAIARAALRVQGDLDSSWRPEWGLLLERAHLAKILETDLWRKYAEQTAILPNFAVRRRVARGEMLSMRIDCDGERGRFSDDPVDFIATGKVRVFVDGHLVSGQLLDEGARLSDAGPGSGADSFKVASMLGDTLRIPVDELPGLALGRHFVRVIFDGDIGFYHGYWTAEKEEHIAPEHFELDGTWTLLPHGQPTVTTIDPSTSPEYAAGFWQHYSLKLGFKPEGVNQCYIVTEPPSGGLAKISGGEMEDRVRPLDLAYQMFARLDGREVPIGTLWYFADQDRFQINKTPDAWRLLLGRQKVSILLRHDAYRATEQVNMNRIWGGDHVFLNIPVQYYNTTPAR